MTITTETFIGAAEQLEKAAIVMNPGTDHVAVARREITSGSCLNYYGDIIIIRDTVPRGNRFALADLRRGEFVRQYGYPFGQSAGIMKGETITSANIINTVPDTGGRKFAAPAGTVYNEKYLEMTFQGYKRKNGTVGTRNYYLIVPTSMCVSETALQAALSMERYEEIFPKYHNIDGIMAVPHTEGCGCASNLQIERFLRVLRGYINHPNVGGCLIMDLGCEQTNYEKVHEYLNGTLEDRLKPIDWLTVQSAGGTRAAIKKAISIIEPRLNEVNRIARESCALGSLTVGTECGASDSFSGITANPVIGNMVDRIISGGGSAILSEIPEVLGTYDMLFSRFRTAEVAERFRKALDWYAGMAEKLGLTLTDNLVAKNIEGGLINNYIKSLGAVLKGGTTAIEDVIEYGEAIRKSGLNIMQGPGGDPESVTGMVASGANIICFSTGAGTTTGSAVCPVIKISSNSDTFKRLPEDIDFNAGRILDEQISIGALGEELLEKVVSVASGEKTWSEKWKQRQFQVWTAGKLSL